MTIAIVEVKAALAVVVRKVWPVTDLRQAQQEARRTLEAALQEHGDRLGARLTVWRPLPNGMMDYAPGVLLSHPIEVAGDASLFTLPAGRAAHSRMVGPWQGLPAAWQSLFDGCREEGHEPAGLNWEVYAAGDSDPVAALYALLVERRSPNEARPSIRPPRR